MINCEIELNLPWSKNCITSEISRTRDVPTNPDANSPVPAREATLTTGTTFQINEAKLDVPLITLSINTNIKFLEHLKQGFRRTISWNKYRSEIIMEPKNNNLHCAIHPRFRNINRLFILSLTDDDYDFTLNSFDNYYMPLDEIKNFNALIGNKPFFDQPVKNKQ